MGKLKMTVLADGSEIPMAVQCQDIPADLVLAATDLIKLTWESPQ